MELFANLALGLQTAISPANLLYCLIGCVLGTLVGVLPGLGPAATIAMLLPATFSLDPTGSLIMLAGIFYGAQYGGSTTAILINLPGETASVVTTLDGYQMARQGRAGLALSTAALGSFFAGTVATLAIATFAPFLGKAALKFGPPEYFSLIVLGLVASVTLSSGSLVKSLGMVVIGLVCGLVGPDRGSTELRFTFGVPELGDGLNVVAVAMGMFGVGEIIDNLRKGREAHRREGAVPQFVAPMERHPGDGACGRARNDARRPAGAVAGRRRYDVVVRRLRAREEGREGWQQIRQGRARRRGRAGGRK